MKEDTKLCFHRVFRFSLSFSDLSWFWLLSPLVSTDATHIQCFYTRYCVVPWLVENRTYTYMLQSSKMPYTQLQFLQIVSSHRSNILIFCTSVSNSLLFFICSSSFLLLAKLFLYRDKVIFKDNNKIWNIPLSTLIPHIFDWLLSSCFIFQSLF